jgi:hypothetical protein
VDVSFERWEDFVECCGLVLLGCLGFLLFLGFSGVFPLFTLFPSFIYGAILPPFGKSFEEGCCVGKELVILRTTPSSDRVASFHKFVELSCEGCEEV